MLIGVYVELKYTQSTMGYTYTVFLHKHMDEHSVRHQLRSEIGVERAFE